MADLQTDVEAAVAALAVVQSDVAAGEDPNVAALKEAAITYAVSQGYTAPAPVEPAPAEVTPNADAAPAA